MTDQNAFSQRHNHQESVPIVIRDDAPDLFREFLRATMRHYLYDDFRHDGSEFVFISLGKVPRNSWRAAKNEIFSLPWYKVYDLLEAFYQKVCAISKGHAENLRTLINKFFEDNGYAYKLSSDGQVEYRGDESFELAVNTANMALSDAGLTTAQTEIHKALEDLAKRPTADLTGAVQHAMAGLECAAKQVAKEPKLELGKIVKKHPNLFPPPLGDVVTQLYGYASNNGRHLTEGGEPNFAEVELVVGIATTAATYLARKTP